MCSPVRIEQIEPVEALAPEEAELLQVMLDDAPDLERSELRLYRIRAGAGPPRSLVAPASPTLGVGMTVECVGWTKAAQIASSGSPDTLELSVAAKLVASDHDA